MVGHSALVQYLSLRRGLGDFALFVVPTTKLIADCAADRQWSTIF